MAGKWQPRLKRLPRLFCYGEHGWHFSFSTKWRRQNTQYVDDRCNWVCACDSCFEQIEEYWRERWAEYYASIR